MATGDRAAVDVVLRAYQRMQDKNAIATAALSARHQVKPVHLRALLVLAARGPLPATSLGAAVGLSSGAVTPMIDRLERHGHAVRSPAENDRRSVIIAALPLGLDVVADLHASYAAVLARALGGRLDEAANVFEALGDALEEEVASW